MAHPYAEHRQHKTEKARVHTMTKGYASGGAVRHDDEAQDRKLVKHMLNEHDRKMDGDKARPRMDRVARASGGRVNKKDGKTTVNIMIAGGDKNAQPVPVPVPGPPAGPPGGPPPGGPPMMPPGGPPPGMPMRASGG